MNNDKENKENPIARRQFLRTCGTIIAGGSVVAVSGTLLKRTMGKEPMQTANLLPVYKENTASPYKLIASFDIGVTGANNAMKCFELYKDKLYVADVQKVSVFDISGKQVNNFAVENNVRDIAVSDDEIYLLYPTGIDVYSLTGEKIRNWEACSDNSDYCSFTLSAEFVFVTDASNKHICKYDRQGGFVKFINSPNRFIIPSYTFGIEVVNDVLYCSNSGRHQVESFSLDGVYLGSFGKAGGAAGLFTGCCNPVHISATSWGDVITSEKGDPRISCYGSDGKFRSILLDSKSLGGGNKAYDVKTQDDKLYVAGANKISIFQFDKNSGNDTACGSCAVNCPLRV
ncbi:MAG: hypothetical protein LBT50_10100 [Prevotellaceae bacterium]|jgi:hypothetical protein|nr:hypothetical protein [Prevotellaceae bacterium]